MRLLRLMSLSFRVMAQCGFHMRKPPVPFAAFMGALYQGSRLR
jgi:hypothetical protein